MANYVVKGVVWDLAINQTQVVETDCQTRQLNKKDAMAVVNWVNQLINEGN